MELFFVLMTCLAVFLLLLSRKLRKSAQAKPPADDMVKNQELDLDDLPPCPNCGTEDVARIIYGKPALTRQIMEGLKSGKIVSGGCMVQTGAPQWRCNHCNSDFGHIH